MAVDAKTSLIIAKRDRWHCRYSGEPVVLSVLYQAWALVYPEIRYNKNHRADATEGEVVSHSLQIDHHVAKANQGMDDIENLFTSAARWNIQKGKRTDWPVLPIVSEEKQAGWDGGLAEFMALVEAHPRLLDDQMIARWYCAERVLRDTPAPLSPSSAMQRDGHAAEAGTPSSDFCAPA
jgi:hypothetical protein